MVASKNTFVLLIGLAALWGCSGPERAPHQPITGVDRPYDPPPESRGSGSSTEDVDDDDGSPPAVRSNTPEPEPVDEPRRSKHFLGSFIDEVALAALDAPGNIAIFPAMARDEVTSRTTVNGLGDHLAETTATELELAGVSGIVHGSQLINDILATNRGLDSWRALNDVYWIAERIGARYAIFGTANRQTFDRLARDEALEIVWRCIRVDDRHVVATYRRELKGDLSRELYRYTKTETSWRIGEDAEPFQPSLDAELRIAMRVLGQRIAFEHAAKLSGKRTQVDPMAIAANRGERAELQAWAAAFQRAFDQAERRADDGSVLNRDAVWSSGPVTIQGTEHATFLAALDAFEQKNAAAGASRTASLSKDLSSLLGASLQGQLGDRITLVSDDSERQRLLQVIRSDAAAAQQDDAVDPTTIAMLSAEGAEVLITSALRPIADSYRIEVVVTDLTTGSKSIEDFPIEPQFSAELLALAGR